MKKNKLITDDKSIAKFLMTTWSQQLNTLERNEFDSKHVKLSNNPVLSALSKFQNHPSILKIKSNRTYSGFSFRPVSQEEVLTEL